MDRIRDFSHQQFPYILEARLRRRAERAEKGAEDMDYSARLRETASKKRKAEESARQGSSKKQNVEPRLYERTTIRAKKTPEQTRATPKSSARPKTKAAAPQSAQQSARQGAHEEAARRQQTPQGDSARRPVPLRDAFSQPEPGCVVLSLAAEKARGKRKQKGGLSSIPSGSSNLATPNHIEFNFDDEANQFVNDRRACGEFLYSVHNTDYPVSELDDLEENYTFLNYARSSIRSEALLNQLIADYQDKLLVAWEEAARARNDEHLKAELEKEHNENMVLKSKIERLEKDSAATIASLKSDLTSRVEEHDGLKICYNRLRRSNDALNVDHEKLRASIEPISARLERLRLRFVYLEQVKEQSALLDEVRGTLDCLKVLKDDGVEVPQDTLDMMEEDLKSYELQVKEVAVVELEEDELTPSNAELPEGRAE